ncbi:MAG: hypothetical protein ACLGSH_08215 [Acidobacteriota bacterium]
MAKVRDEFTGRSEHIEELVRRLRTQGDLGTRAIAKELLQCVLKLHGAALEQILDAIADMPGGDAALRRVGQNVLVGSVLSLHGIFPLAPDLESEADVNSARLLLRPREAGAKVIPIERGSARLKLLGAWSNSSVFSFRAEDAADADCFDAAGEMAAAPGKAAAGRRPNLVEIGRSH